MDDRLARYLRQQVELGGAEVVLSAAGRLGGAAAGRLDSPPNGQEDDPAAKQRHSPHVEELVTVKQAIPTPESP
ncbi:MAG: hypothetical protein JNM53_07890, partial [Gemmatimonadetes bacterium]|nr:hypothetical protein [Gemmatimonadota bacterium]